MFLISLFLDEANDHHQRGQCRYGIDENGAGQGEGGEGGEGKRGEGEEGEKEQVNRMYLPIWSNWLKTPIFAVTGKKKHFRAQFWA